VQRLAAQFDGLLRMGFGGQRRQRSLIGAFVSRGLVATSLRIASGRLIAPGWRFTCLRPRGRGEDSKTTNRAHGKRHAPESWFNPRKCHVDTIHPAIKPLAVPPPHDLTSNTV
jgi:hypothetical protein